MAITAFLSRSPGLLKRGPGGPASLGHVPHSSIFSVTGLISNWLNFLCTELYNSSSPTFFLTQIAFIQPDNGHGYILIFLDRMHLLFTQVHFLFWQLGRGHYITIRILRIIFLLILLKDICNGLRKCSNIICILLRGVIGLKSKVIITSKYFIYSLVVRNTCLNN